VQHAQEGRDIGGDGGGGNLQSSNRKKKGEKGGRREETGIWGWGYEKRGQEAKRTVGPNRLAVVWMIVQGHESWEGHAGTKGREA